MTSIIVAGNTLLTRRVLPETTVLGNMTGHAMWQTFLNQSTAQDRHTRDGDAYHNVLQVRYMHTRDGDAYHNVLHVRYMHTCDGDAYCDVFRVRYTYAHDGYAYHNVL